MKTPQYIPEPLATPEDWNRPVSGEAASLAMDHDNEPLEHRIAVEKEVAEILASLTPEDRAEIRARQERAFAKSRAREEAARNSTGQ
jgi:hypothetical protein